MIVIATLFLQLKSVKGLVIPLCKNHRLRTPFVSQHGKGSQSLFLLPFLEPKSNLKHCENEYDLHIYFISEITDCEMPG